METTNNKVMHQAIYDAMEHAIINMNLNNINDAKDRYNQAIMLTQHAIDTATNDSDRWNFENIQRHIDNIFDFSLIVL